MKKEKRFKIKWSSWKLITLLSISFLFIFSGISVIPGCAIESLSLINSVKKVVNTHIPKGKYVIDGTSKIYSDTAEIVLKNTFEFDGMLACNSYDSEDRSKKTEIKDYAEKWYNDNWKDKIAAKEDIDLNTFSMNVVEFDISVSKKFFSKGLTTPGIAWMFTNFSDVFSSKISKLYSRYGKVADQDVYDSYVQATTPGVFNEAEVTLSPGNYVVNQKTYFLNYQLQVIKSSLSVSVLAESPYKDKTLKESDIELISPSDLSRPDLTNTLNYLRFSIVLLIISTVSLIGFGTYLTIDHVKGKNKNEKTA